MDRLAAVRVRSLVEFFQEVPDHRRGNRSHPLSAVLALTTCAMLCGARSLYAAAQWGRDHGQPLVGADAAKPSRPPGPSPAFYPSKLGPEELLALWRGHWGIETRLLTTCAT